MFADTGNVIGTEEHVSCCLCKNLKWSCLPNDYKIGSMRAMEVEGGISLSHTLMDNASPYGCFYNSDDDDETIAKQLLKPDGKRIGEANWLVWVRYSISGTYSRLSLTCRLSCIIASILSADVLPRGRGAAFNI